MSGRTRLIFKDSEQQAMGLQDLAEREGWVVTSAGTATADSPLEIVWMPDPDSVVRYIEDSFAHAAYVQLEGLAADKLAQKFHRQFDLWSRAEIEALAGSKDARSVADAMMLAGLSAPEQPDDAYRRILELGLHHADAEVRARTIEALAYPAWPAMTSELSQLAADDADRHVRDLADRLVQILERAA